MTENRTPKTKLVGDDDEQVADDGENVLVLNDLVKIYGSDVVALDGVSLSINRGEFVCFLGPSGCGKTTLLRLIAGLDYQTSGQIIQNGSDISWLPPSHRDFGIVFQSYALFPNLTVKDNIAYGLVNKKIKKETVDDRVAELLGLVDLPEQENKYPWQLSGGQQQRVALARALAISPSLLLLDEPLSALDAQVRVHLRNEIRALQKRLGVTTIMVTHDQEEAMTIADRVVVINNGVIEQIGTPKEIYRNPKSIFVANFIGTINLLPCHVVDSDTVTACGVKLRCPNANYKAGDEAQIAIRPEDIFIHRDSEGENCFSVSIDKIEFMGAFSRVHMVHDSGTVFIADCAGDIMRESSITKGGMVNINLPHERFRLYPAA